MTVAVLRRPWWLRSGDALERLAQYRLRRTPAGVPAPPDPDPGGGGTPSGEAMPTTNPTGWPNRVFQDDFNVNIPEGQWGIVNSADWTHYPSNYPDTSRLGFYGGNQVISQHDGVLDLWLRHKDGVWRGATPIPRPASFGRTNIRIASRFRADQVAGFSTAWLMWPTSEQWPRDGELDFPEGNLHSTIGGFMHRQGATTGSDQDGMNTGQTYAQWHTSVMEWDAGVRCKFILDGVTYLDKTSRVPNTPMRYVMQTETWIGQGPVPGGTSTNAHVLVDWVVIWSR